MEGDVVLQPRMTEGDCSSHSTEQLDTPMAGTDDDSACYGSALGSMPSSAAVSISHEPLTMDLSAVESASCEASLTTFNTPQPVMSPGAGHLWPPQTPAVNCLTTQSSRHSYTVNEFTTSGSVVEFSAADHNGADEDMLVHSRHSRSSSRASSIASSRLSSRVGTGRRTFVRSTEKQTGLNTGDVIMFLAPGGQQVYAVAQHMPTSSPEPPFTANTSHLSSSRSPASGRKAANNSKAAAVLAAVQSPVQFVLHLVEEDEVTNSRGSCFLEVVRQGTYLGFRSAAAGGRFLQARRRGQRCLVFFSGAFGVYEQWEAVEGAMDLEQPWERLRLGLRSRQLPHFVLHVEVLRVGAFVIPLRPSVICTSPGSDIASVASDSSASLMAALAAAGRVSVDVSMREDVNLAQIERLVLSEWCAFVEHEKGERHVVEAEVEELMYQLQELRDTVTSQVDGLRDEMWCQIGDLLEAMQAKDSAIAALKSQARRKLAWGVAVLMRHSHVRVQQEALRGWRELMDASQARETRALHMLTHKQAALARSVLLAWQAHAHRCARSRSLLLRASGRISKLQAARAFKALRAAAVTRRQSRAKCAMAVERRAKRCLGLAFGTWQDVIHARHQGRKALHGMAANLQLCTLRSTFHAWHITTAISAAKAHATASRRQQQLQRSCLGAWKARCQATAEAVKHAEALCEQRQHTSLRSAVHSWHAATVSKRRWTHRVNSCRQSASRRQLASVFAAWRCHAHAQRLLRRQLQLVQGKVHRSLLEHAFGRLKGAVQERRCKAVAVKRADAWQQRRTLRGCWAALQATAHTAQHVRSSAVQALTQRRLQSAFKVWRVQAGQAKAVEQELAPAHCEAHLMRRALRAWQAAKGASEHQRQQHARAAAKSSSLLKRKALAGWVEVMSMQGNDSFGSRSISRNDSVSVSVRSRQLLAAAWRAWTAHVLHTATAKQQIMRGIAKANRSLQRRACMAWKGAVQLQAQLQHSAQEQRDRRAKALALRSWQFVAQQQQAKRQQQHEAVQRLQRSQLRVVMRQWRECVAAKRRAVRKQMLLQGRRSQAMLRACLESWHSLTSTQSSTSPALTLERVAQLALKTKQRKQQHDILLAMHGVATARKRTTALIARAASKASRACLASALSAWLEAVAVSRKHKRLVQLVGRRLQHGMLAAAFAGWCSRVQARQQQRSSLQRCVRRLGRLQLAAAFTTWRECAEQSVAAKAAAAAKAEALARRQLAAAWTAWRAAVGAKAAARAAGLTAASHHTRVFMAKAVLSWKQHCHTQRSNEVAHSHAAKAVLGKALSGWSKQMQRQAHLRRSAAVITARGTVSTVSLAWRSWRSAVDASAAAAAQAQRLQGRRQRRTLAACLAAWASLVDARAVQMAAMGRLMQQQQERQLQMAVRGWAAVVQKRRQQSVWVAVAAQRLQGFSLRRLFSAWRQQAQLQQHQKEQELQQKQQVLLLQQQAQLELCKRLKHAGKQQRRRMAQVLCKAGCNRRLRACFGAWMGLVHDTAYAEQSAGKRADRKLLLQAWGGWRSQASSSMAVGHLTGCLMLPGIAGKKWCDSTISQHQKMSAVQVFASRLVWQRLARSFRAWRSWAAARQLQKRLSAGSMKRAQQVWARRILRSWRVVVVERMEAEERLRTCLRRKRIAFAHYKAWYWQSFQADVQGTLRRMFHATDSITHGRPPSPKAWAPGAAASAAYAAAVLPKPHSSRNTQEAAQAAQAGTLHEDSSARALSSSAAVHEHCIDPFSAAAMELPLPDLYSQQKLVSAADTTRSQSYGGAARAPSPVQRSQRYASTGGSGQAHSTDDRQRQQGTTSLLSLLQQSRQQLQPQHQDMLSVQHDAAGAAHASQQQHLASMSASSRAAGRPGSSCGVRPGQQAAPHTSQTSGSPILDAARLWRHQQEQRQMWEAQHQQQQEVHSMHSSYQFNLQQQHSQQQQRQMQQHSYAAPPSPEPQSMAHAALLARLRWQQMQEDMQQQLQQQQEDEEEEVELLVLHEQLRSKKHKKQQLQEPQAAARAAVGGVSRAASRQKSVLPEEPASDSWCIGAVMPADDAAVVETTTITAHATCMEC